MQLITLLIEFIKHPKHIGAIAPSSKILAEKMVDAIDFEDARYIVEITTKYGFVFGSFLVVIFGVHYIDRESKE